MKEFNNLYKLFFFLTIILSIGMISMQSKAYAAGSLNVNWGVPNNSPVFSLNNMAPGQASTKTITVTNSTTNDLAIGIRGDITNQTGNIANVMHIMIANGNNTLYGANNSKTLSQFFSDASNGQFIQLGTVNKNNTATYTVTVTFDQSADNQYQGKNLTFSLSIGSDSTNIHPTPSPTFTPTPTPTIGPIGRPVTLQQLLTAIFQQQQQLFKLIFGNIFH